jgi:la-related protein 1
MSAHHGHPSANPYDYPMQAQMGNMPTYPVGPYSPALAPEGFALLKAQLEYYFSVDNLCKDLYLRMHMDTQGFVPLTMIAQFKRLRDITDDLDILGNACEDSAKLEIVTVSNGTELVRPINDWRPFVLPMPDRKPLAQHDGPTELVFRSRLLMGNQWYPAAMGYPATPTGVVYGNGMADHQFRVEPVHRSSGGGVMNGMMNNVGAGHVPDTPLSAAVSEFSPSALTSSHSMLPNGRAATFVPAGQDNDLANYGVMAGGAFHASHLPPSSTTHEESKPGSVPVNGFLTMPATADVIGDEYQGV